MPMENEQIIAVVDQRLADVKFDIREIGADVKRLRSDMEELREIVIGRGGPETLMALVNGLVSSERVRKEEEVDLKKMRRNLMISAGGVGLTAIGGVLWALAKILP